MIAWLESLHFWLADFYLLATALLLLAATGARWFRQPVERLEWCRALTFSLAAVAVLTALPGWPRWGIWEHRGEEAGLSKLVPQSAKHAPGLTPVRHSQAVDYAALEAAKLDEAFAAIDALLGESRPPSRSNRQQPVAKRLRQRLPK